ncbi:MAG: CarD family transcriptional regulator [Chloroflexota bacterium]
MTFEIGERVVHPQHGLGYVVSMEVRAFEPGVNHAYYEISIPGGSTVWVPIKGTGSGVRKLATRDEIARCRMILKSPPAELAEDARMRQSELNAHLKKGTIASHCEVVRDLAAYGAHRSMFGNIGAFLRAAQDVLSQEWALVEGTTLAEAAFEITALLETGKQAMSEAVPSENAPEEGEMPASGEDVP